MEHPVTTLEFDRGTLLIRGNAIELQSLGLPNALFDRRISEFRAPAFKYAAILEWAKERRVIVSDNVSTQCMPASLESSAKPLRAYQAAALGAWAAAGSRGIVCLPTGSGKTRVAIEAIATENASCLVLVPTRVLLEQWLDVLQDTFSQQIGVLGDGRRLLCPLTVATYESAYRLMEKIGHRFRMLVVDEVHHFGETLRDEALEMCAAPLRLGLTATPPDDASKHEKLGSLMGPIVYTLKLEEVKAALAPFRVESIPIELSKQERLTYEENWGLLQKFKSETLLTLPHLNSEELLRVATCSEQGRRALRARKKALETLSLCGGKIKKLAHLLSVLRGRRTLVFTADAVSAFHIASRFLLPPFIAELPRAERQFYIKGFKDGIFPVLVSCQVLNEGFDVGEADVAIIMGGRLGEREHIQRIGRVLRPGPGKEALIYELVCHNTVEVAQSRRRAKVFRAAAR